MKSVDKTRSQAGSARRALSPEDEQRLLGVVKEYLEALEAGRRPLRNQYLERFPDLADVLGECLDSLEFVRSATPQLPARQESSAPLPELGQAQALGDFRIVREIGRGGMGVVYEAVQMSLGRPVALKVLPFAAALDTKQLKRFKNEAQAAAQLHHTNIVPVYGVGCERGVHYYAMQLIEGQNLADLITQLAKNESQGKKNEERTKLERKISHPRTDPTPPPTSAASRSAGQDRMPATGPGAETRPANTQTASWINISTQRASRRDNYYRTAAGIGIQAAEGLEHAHQLGVIHRDVKPANLMVDAGGNVWITDFGLAQFHTNVGLTRTGDLLGTLRYMSPEQAAGQGAPLDPRTDVYSLGATLYELLTLRPMFDGDSHHYLLRQIMQEEPRPLSALDPAVPSELETIVLKAASKNPSDRYATARELADDLRRFLDNQPILARRPTLVQRVRKWGRRHPSVVFSAVILLILVTAGSIVSAALINAEREKTKEAYDRERKRAEESEKQFRLARRAADELIQMAEEELADYPFLESLRKRLLESALAYYQEFMEERREDPGAQTELAATRDRVKKIIADLAVLQGAGQFFLLREKGVLDDLKVTEEQRENILDLNKKMDEQRDNSFREFHRLAPEERSRKFLEMARTNDLAIAGIFSPEQLKRLRQIALQSKGTMAFREPEVVAALKLTSQQREKIRAIEGDFFPKGDRPPPGPGFGPRSGPGHGPDSEPGPGPHRFKGGFEAMRRNQLQQIEALLTKEQLQHWRDMAGELYTGPLPGFFPGPPRPFDGPRPKGNPSDRKS